MIFEDEESMKNCSKYFRRRDYHWEQVSWRRFLILPSSFASSCCTNLVLFIVIYHFDTQGISFIAGANNKVKRGQNNSKTRNHSPSIRLKGFESARILWRSSLSSSRQFSSSSMSMLWRPSQSSLMSSRSWDRQLLCESSNEEWKQHHWFVVKIWGCFNTMMTFTLSMTPLLPTVLCLAAPIEFWTANRRRLYKRQGHCYKVDVWLWEWWRL